MTQPKTSIKTVGILGGGQLSAMICDAARSLKIKTVAYLQSEDEPAARRATQTIQGAFDDEQSLSEFFSSIDILLFENEFFSPRVLEVAKAHPHVQCVPEPPAIAQLANKLNQKKLASNIGIPSSRFLVDDGSVSPHQWLEQLRQPFPQGYVLKWARGGYDGKGNLICHPAQFSDASKAKEAEAFVAAARDRKIELYAEEMIDFDTEFAVLTVRSVKEETISYPAVITRQEKGVCVEAKGPATHFGLSRSAEGEALGYAINLAKQAHLYGCFALEFFMAKDGRVLLNEIAPRVHNSGHFSLNATSCSQFENHLRAALGQPLIDPGQDDYFGMVNILGPEGYNGPPSVPHCDGPQSWVHWYDKKMSRPGRKLGHINLRADDKVELEHLINAARLSTQSWAADLTRSEKS